MLSRVIYHYDLLRAVLAMVDGTGQAYTHQCCTSSLKQHRPRSAQLSTSVNQGCFQKMNISMTSIIFKVIAKLKGKEKEAHCHHWMHQTLYPWIDHSDRSRDTLILLPSLNLNALLIEKS